MTERYIVKLPRELYQNQKLAPPSGVRGRILKKVEFPKSGGVLAYFENTKYPTWGLMDMEILGRVNSIKKYAKSKIEMIATPPFI